MPFSFRTCVPACNSSLPKSSRPASSAQPGMLASWRVASTFAVGSATSRANSRPPLSTWALTAAHPGASGCATKSFATPYIPGLALVQVPVKFFSASFNGRPSILFELWPARSLVQAASHEKENSSICGPTPQGTSSRARFPRASLVGLLLRLQYHLVLPLTSHRHR